MAREQQRPAGGPTIPEAARPVYEAVVWLIDADCREHLNEEYRVMCRQLAGTLARKRPSPPLSGKPATWAFGTVRTIGWVNFLDDSSRQPHLKLTAIDKAFGVAESTGQGKSKAIRTMLKFRSFDPKWRLASWRCPEDFEPEEPVLYAEPLFNEALAQRLGLAVVEPPEDFLARLPHGVRQAGDPADDRRRGQDAARPGVPQAAQPQVVPAESLRQRRTCPRCRTKTPCWPPSPSNGSPNSGSCFGIAWSPYWLNGAMARDGDEWVVGPDLAAATRGLVDRLLTDPDVNLPVALVLDAGVIRDVGPAVVEANEESGARIYGCDPRDVLEVLRAATVNPVP